MFRETKRDSFVPQDHSVKSFTTSKPVEQGKVMARRTREGGVMERDVKQQELWQRSKDPSWGNKYPDLTFFQSSDLLLCLSLISQMPPEVRGGKGACWCRPQRSDSGRRIARCKGHIWGQQTTFSKSPQVRQNPKERKGKSGRSRDKAEGKRTHF